MLYDICSQKNIPHKKITKLIVSTNQDEEEELHSILEHARSCGTKGLSMLSKKQVNNMEPDINATAAILSANTGIIDSHSWMKYLDTACRENDCMRVYSACVTDIQNDNGYHITVNNDYTFSSAIVINAAGLWCENIASMAGLDTEKLGYRIYLCRGEYYTLEKKISLNRLVYPVPAKEKTSLGVHLTLDLAGRIRLGPDAKYINKIDYSIDETGKHNFLMSARKLIPDLEESEISPESAGIRPKLQGPGDPVRDFIIKHETDNGLPGFINLIGIESPGLTSSPAIGEYVKEMVKEII